MPDDIVIDIGRGAIRKVRRLGGAPPTPPAVVAAGATVTARSLATWRSRAASGPFKAANDYTVAGHPGEWDDDIVGSKDTFVADPASRRWSGTSASSDPLWGTFLWIGRAAFFSLVADDASVRAITASEIAVRATSTVDFSNRTDWPTGSVVNPRFEVANMMAGHALVLDYLLVGDAAALTAQQKSDVMDWLYHFADWAIANLLDVLDDDFTDVDLLGDPASWTPGGDLVEDGNTWDGGPANGPAGAMSANFANKNMQIWRAAGIAAAVLEYYGHTRPAGSRLDYTPAQMIVACKNAVKAWLTYGCYPLGYNVDFVRSVSGGTGPDKGLYYAFGALAPVLSFVHVLAVGGDEELLTWTTRDGWGSSVCGEGDPDKSVPWMTVELLKHVDADTYDRTIFSGRIDLVNAIYEGGRNNDDMSAIILHPWMPAGPDKDYVKDVVERQRAGQPGVWVPDAANWYGASRVWVFDWGLWPGAHFQFNGVTP